MRPDDQQQSRAYYARKYQTDRGGRYLRNASGSVFASISKGVSLVEFASPCCLASLGSARVWRLPPSQPANFHNLSNILVQIIFFTASPARWFRPHRL